MNKEPDKYYKCIKVALKSILRKKYYQKGILINVNKITKIYTNALQIIKLYYLNEVQINNNHLMIDENLILAALKVVCIDNGIKQKESIQIHVDKMRILYENVYSKLNIFNNLDYDGLATSFQYLAVEILTNFENNIKCRYYDYVVRFVNTFFAKKAQIEEIRNNKNLSKNERDKLVSNFCKMLNKFKDDLLNVKDKKYKSGEHLHKLIDHFKKIILPNKEKYEKESVIYDVNVHPKEYFKCMFNIVKLIELYGGTKFNLFPFRVSIIPKHMKLDSTTIVNILFDKDKAYYKNNLKNENYNIWNKIINLNLKVFRKKGYKFNNSIITDGVSCSILFVKEEYYGKFIPKFKFKNISNEKYIDELSDDDYERIINKKIIAIDPNKGDLLYCIDNINKERNHFRYTQDQRRKETKIKKYQKIRETLKQHNIDGKTVKQLETELADNERRTLDYEKYIEYLKNKNAQNIKLWDFYQDEIFRKLNLNVYLNTLRSEQRMINNMQKKFGEAKESVICIGDWEQKKQMKYKEPTKGKSFRELLRKYGFEVYLVNEYNTSKKCSLCHNDCEKFMERENPKPYREGKILVHGLLKCKTCQELWNRDENSSINIYILALNAIARFDRPEYLSRT
jgi:hypothetical protein